MRKLWLAIALWAGLIAPATAQNFNMPPPAGVTVGAWSVVASCGAQSLSPSTPAFGTMDETGKVCVNATVSASVSGFQPTPGYGTPLSVSSTSSRTALPTGAVVIAYNVGSTNGAYCTIGNSSVVATTSDDFIAPNSWLAYTVGSAVDIACITASSTTTVNTSGGSGLATGAGGGGGGSGSNASVSATGSSVPASATYIGITSGGNLTGWNGQVTNGGTFAVQASQATASSLNATVVQSTASNFLAEVFGGAANGSAVNGNPVLITGSDGTDARSMLMSSTGQPHIICDSGCSGSGGTSSSFGSAFPSTGTAIGLTNGTNMVAWSATSNYGTAPSAIPVPAVNAFITGGTLGATVTGNALVKGTTAAMTGTSSTQVIAAVTSQHIYVTAVHCNNSSSTATLVSLQDGSGGTTLDTLICPAGGGDERNGGGFPLFWTTAGNGFYAADVTTGASVIVQASGYSSAN